MSKKTMTFRIAVQALLFACAMLFGCASLDNAKPTTSEVRNPRSLTDSSDIRLLSANIGDMKIVNRSIESTLGQLLFRCREARPQYDVHFVLWCRDRLVRKNPTSMSLRDEALLKTDSSGVIYLVAHDITLLEALQSALPAVGYTFKMVSHNDEFHLHVGPPELLTTNYERYTYQILDEYRERVEALQLPNKLPLGGSCMAYDAENGLLTIIDETADPLAFMLASVIGEKRGKPVGKVVLPIK